MLNYDFIALPKIYRHLTGNELKVFCVLFDEWNLMKNKDGWFYRSWKSLREDTLLSNDGLNNAINGLIKKNLLRKTEYPHKQQKSNDYQIVMEEVLRLVKTEPTPKKRVAYSEKKSTSKNNITKNNKNKNKINNYTCVPETIIKEKNEIKKESEIGTMEKNSTKDSSYWDFYNSLDDDDDNGVSDNGTNGMKLDDSSTVDTNTNEHTSRVDKTETDPTTIEKDKSQNYGILNMPPTPTSEIEKKRAIILPNIESGKKFMYEACKMENLANWSMQFQYITEQFKQLKEITSTDAYASVRKEFKNWWDKTKQFFPKGYEKIVNPPKTKKPTKIQDIDITILNYWKEQKSIENVKAVLERWKEKYDQDTLDNLLQETIAQINASCGSQTTYVDNYPTQEHKTQPEPKECPQIEDNELEETTDKHAQIIYINSNQPKYNIN